MTTMKALASINMDRLRSSPCKAPLVVIQTGRRRRWTMPLTRSYLEVESDMENQAAGF
jgi:hypothetical protein